ncbi:MAG: ABC transporter permease [Eubacterium sp.]|nr:ABC transporter permease [Eubacterium sp.]
MEQAVEKEKVSLLSKINIRAILPFIGLIVVFIIFNILTGGKMISQIKLILSQVYMVMISSMGVFFIMTMGGLDFSQGSILGMSSIVICALSNVAPMPVALIGGILAGAAVGAFNGFFYVNRKVKSFIVTICTMFLLRGIIKYITADGPVNGLSMVKYNSDAVKLISTIVILAVGFIFFRFTRFGMDLKAIGAGEKAAKFSGVKTNRLKFLIYVLSGAITGYAAFINVIKSGSATYNSGNQLETQILIALVLGGMPISGGAKARFECIIIGSLLYFVLENGLAMMGMEIQTRQLIKGVIFLAFVALFADRKSLKVIK